MSLRAQREREPGKSAQACEARRKTDDEIRIRFISSGRTDVICIEISRVEYISWGGLICTTESTCQGVPEAV